MQENVRQLQPGQHRWRQAFAFGLPLALLELGALALFYTNYEILSPVRAITLALLLYLVVSVLAGYWFCRHGGRYGVWAGLRAGLTGAAVFLFVMALLFAVLWVRYVNMPRFPGEWGLYDPAMQLKVYVQAIGILAAISGAGILLSALGGWLGGLIARWRPEPRERVGEQRA